MCFSSYLCIRWGGGVSQGIGTQPAYAMQFFTPDSSEIEVFETCFFDISTTQNDHPRYVMHVLRRICVFFILFGY